MKSTKVFVLVVLVLCVCFMLVACDSKKPVESEVLPDTVSITYNANGGVGEMTAQVVEKGNAVKLKQNAFNKDFNSFKGWATSSNGEVVYQNAQTINQINESIALYAVWEEVTFDFNAIQPNNNEESIKVSWENIPTDTNSIEITVKHGDTIVATKTIDSNINCEAGNTILDNVFFGKFSVSVKLISANNNSIETTYSDIKVKTDSLDFAVFNGTFPVSLFTLMKMDADTTKLDSSAKTYVYLSRPKAYDWDNLPSNIAKNPVAHGKAWDTAVELTKAWIRELYEINNDTQFNLYFTDNYIYILQMMFVENDIPQANYTATMFSDGSGTAGYLVNTFNIANPGAKYEEMETAWNSYLTNHGRSTLPYGTFTYPEYSAIVCNTMSNVKWYTGRLRTTENVVLQDVDFANTLVNGTKTNGREEFYLNNLLNALSNEEKATFKTVYHIDENTFADAGDKKVMMILGTSQGGESGNLETYIRATAKVYGDEYAYYYKPHPGWGVNPERTAMIEDLAEDGLFVYELEAAVAAEFFLFFFPDIEMVGYDSTTFASGTDDNANGVFGQAPASYQYADLLETFYNYIAKDNATKKTEIYDTYDIALDVDKTYCLVQFTNELAADKDIGIYCLEDDTIKYYKSNGVLYEEVA